MLIGEYAHTIDPKKRLSLPAKFRKELGKSVIVTRGLDGCLFVYSHSSWKRMVGKVEELSVGSAEGRGFNRFMLAGATEADVDSAGRILIPDFLKSFAALKTKVVLTGVNDRVEIWDETRWQSYTREMEKKGDQMAQKLSDVGMI